MTREEQIKKLPQVIKAFDDVLAQEYLSLKPEDVETYMLGVSAGVRWTNRLHEEIKNNKMN